MTSALVERLRSGKPYYAARVIEDMYTDPFWSERFEARGRRHSEQDLAFHVDYLIQAVIADDRGVMERYARWLQSVLTTRGMCTLHLADSFGRLADAIHDASVVPYLDAARVALLYPAGGARAIQERIRVAITTRTPDGIEDTAYHIAYLADAVALGQPRVFVAHVTWLAKHLERHGKAPTGLKSVLAALARTIDVEPAPGLIETALRELG